MLAAELDMAGAALHLLGGGVDVAHFPLEAVAGEDRGGAGLVVGEFGDLLGLLDLIFLTIDIFLYLLPLELPHLHYLFSLSTQ